MNTTTTSEGSQNGPHMAKMSTSTARTAGTATMTDDDSITAVDDLLDTVMPYVYLSIRFLLALSAVGFASGASK